MALASSSTITKQVGGRRLLLSDGFPDYQSSSYRKLLQTTPKADIVVAQDSTGNYKTISEGVTAAAKLSGKGRVVIHDKAGVYEESVDIKIRSMKNLMIIGDGMGSTIVTSNNNAQDGSTTFRLATFGNERRNIFYANEAPEKANNGGLKL